jgi:molybdate transport repressor ModE-like protein
MSYTKAWHTLAAAEERLSFALLERQAGGTLGGGSTLSASGESSSGAIGPSRLTPIANCRGC